MDYLLTIQHIKEGDRVAMQQLYSHTVAYLTAVCQRYVVDRDDVCDVLQDSYIKIFNNIGSFEVRGEASVRSWMTKIVMNESLMFLRKNKHNVFVDVPEELESPDEMDLYGVSADDVQHAIMKLPTGYRTVLNLYVFEEKSHKEIAELLGIKEASSASQLNRAKKLLKREIMAIRG